MATDSLGLLADDLDATSPGFAGRIRDLASRLVDVSASGELAAVVGDALRRVVELEGPGRDAGLALVSLSAEQIQAAGPEGLRAWCDAVIAIGRTSLRVAQGFASGSLEALVQSAGTVERLAEAGRAVAALAERNAADPIVARFALESGRSLASRSASVVAAWADYCEAAVLGRRRPARGLGELPSAPGLRDEELASALALAALAARRDGEAGEKVFHAAPAALEGVSQQSRESVVALARLLTDAPVALLDLLGIVAPVLRRLERPARWLVIDLACEIARKAPTAAPRFLRSVLRVGEAVGYGHDLEAFVREGLALADRSPFAAEAFFSLETRGARAFLRRHDAAVLIDDVETTLKGYLQLIEGARLSVVGVEESGLFPFIATDAIPVSRRVQLFPIWEENFALVKLQATLATLWRHEGTLEFRLGTWLGGDQPGGIQELCERFAAPDAARGIFVHLETVRLMPILAARYPGLAADLAALRERIFPGDRVESSLGAPGAILYLALDGALERVAWEGAALEPLRKLAMAAHHGEATVYDVATCTAAYCELLTEGELVRIHSLEDFLEDDPMLAYLLELEEDGRPGGPDAPGADTVHPDESHEGEGRRSEDTSEGAAASPELLKAYLEQHPDLEVQRSEGPIDAMGLFVAGLVGSGVGGDEPRRSGDSPDAAFVASRQGREARGVHLHDEWDYRIEDYRVDWCHVHDVVLEGDSGEFFAQALARHRELLPEVRRQFQRVKPEGYRVIRGLLDGEDFDLNAVVTARADLRARRDSSPKLYTARKREERDVATLFLLDMSASTDEETEPADPRGGSSDAARGVGRRVIDIQKEALVIMAQALEEIGDLYAIYGFSGHGRKLVELFTVKSFDEPLSVAVRGRIGSIEPQRSTRMGAALRQASACFRSLAVRGKHMILLSDGFPQDFDYGDDRRSNTYGLKDTAMALREAEQAGISTFCITVDRAGNDYLREMCEERRYLVVNEIDALPRELPKIYSEATRGTL